jgi:hypothetical protein
MPLTISQQAILVKGLNQILDDMFNPEAIATYAPKMKRRMVEALQRTIEKLEE